MSEVVTSVVHSLLVILVYVTHTHTHTHTQVVVCVCANGGSCPLSSPTPFIGNDVNLDTSTIIIPCECDQGLWHTDTHTYTHTHTTKTSKEVLGLTKWFCMWMALSFLLTAWTGPHCTVNIDGCSEGECYSDLPCSDSDEVGVSCPADCGSGLMKDGEKCYGEKVMHLPLIVKTWVGKSLTL